MFLLTIETTDNISKGVKTTNITTIESPEVYLAKALKAFNSLESDDKVVILNAIFLENPNTYGCRKINEGWNR